jgi:transcriptional regulator with XRE-family HTH domain
MRRSSVLGTLATQYPHLFQQMLEWKRSGMLVRDIARQVEQVCGRRISRGSLYHYIWRYERLMEDTDGFWTPERIRRFPEEFIRSMNAYVYAHMYARYDPKIDAQRYVLYTVEAMRVRVIAQEQGKSVPPLSARAVGYRGYTPVPSTVLRKLRTEREWTVAELARRARVGKYTIVKWERYGVVPNSLRSISRIANALGVEISKLLEDYEAYGRIDVRGELFVESDRDDLLVEDDDAPVDHSHAGDAASSRAGVSR